MLRTRIFENRDWTILKVDERFTVANEFHHKKAKTLFFISTENLQEFTSLSAMNYECYLYERSCMFRSANGRLMNFDCLYAQSLLFQYRGNGIVRILDVATGTYLHDVRIPFRSMDKRQIKLLDTWASSNSKVMVVGWKYSKDRFRRVSHLSVYDLEAVKNPNSDPGSHLLYTLQFQFDIHSFVMNENEIAFSGEDDTWDWCVTLLKFANVSFAGRKSYDLELNPEANGDYNEEIVQMKVKKIIYDRVDFDDEDFKDLKKKIVNVKMEKIVNDFVDFDQKDEEDEEDYEKSKGDEENERK